MLYIFNMYQNIMHIFILHYIYFHVYTYFQYKNPKNELQFSTNIYRDS